ncbi:hypothetical protein B0H13DRAFT_2292309 [Mycena leptocephala]|nr:hypothetical protein B0H13DRAFT_2292309 [Mycena leptocephala]
MPLFTSASGVQINGGTFIDTAGDINIIHPPQAMSGQNIGALEFVTEGPSHELSGVERNDRGFGAVRMLPYGMLPAQCNQQDLMKPKDVSQRPQILNRTRSSSLLVADEDPWATFVASGPSFSNSLPSTFLPQEHEFNSQHLLGSLSTTSSSQDFTAGYHEQFYESVNSTGSEHPLFTVAPITGTPEGFSEISSSDNAFGLTLTGHVANPPFATQIFSQEMQPQFRPSLHLPTIVDVSNLQPFGELAPPVIGSVAGTNPRPWDDQSQEQRVINGGTFIGGNLNYIHTTVMPPSVSADQTAQQINNCPLPSRIFHGRQAILDKMHQFFNHETRKQHIYTLHGLGGAGKTQIGLKFINHSSLFADIFFLDASTTATIDTGLKSIATLKNIGRSSQDALKWLTTNQEDWLLFYDNADDPKIDLNGFIPQCNHGNIIITTRNPTLRGYAGAHFAVSDMEESDAVALLLKSAAQEIVPVNKEIAAKIAKAGAFILQSGALDSYLDIYMKNWAQLLNEKPAQSYDNYAWTVYTTWQMSFDQLSPPAAMFLRLCSFLHQDGISEDIFSRAATYRFKQAIPSREALQKPLQFLAQFTDPAGEWDTLRFLKVTNEIKAYSLMSFDPERKMFSIHPLVHSWSQTTITDQQSYHSIMAAIMGMSIEEIPYDHRQLASLKLISHVDSLRHGNQQVVVDFGAQYGVIYWDAGWYEEAKELDLAVLEQRKQVLGDDHPDTLQAMGNLAVTYERLGQYKQAEELQIVVMEKQKQVLGDVHPETLQAMGNLASTYQKLGKVHKAEELEVVVLAKRKQVLGNDHPDTLWTMGNLGSTYKKLGQFHKAEELEAVVLEKRKQVLGDDHPDTLRAMGNLASTYQNLGEFNKAEVLEVVVLEKRKQVLGDDHPDTLRAMGNLASTYHNLGDFHKAEELKVDVLEKRKHILGDDHPDTLWTMGSLAVTYFDLGKFKRAEELEVVVLEKQKQVLGDDHADTLQGMGNLALTYSQLGKFHKAEELGIVALEKQKRLLGANHPDTLQTMWNLASTYRCLGKLSEAEELETLAHNYEEAFEGSEGSDEEGSDDSTQS